MGAGSRVAACDQVADIPDRDTASPIGSLYPAIWNQSRRKVFLFTCLSFQRGLADSFHARVSPFSVGCQPNPLVDLDALEPLRLPARSSVGMYECGESGEATTLIQSIALSIPSKCRYLHFIFSASGVLDQLELLMLKSPFYHAVICCFTFACLETSVLERSIYGQISNQICFFIKIMHFI